MEVNLFIISVFSLLGAIIVAIILGWTVGTIYGIWAALWFIWTIGSLIAMLIGFAIVAFGI